jgi:hypothetical protein
MVTAIFRLNYNQLFTIEIHKNRFNALRNQFSVVSKVTYKNKTSKKNIQPVLERKERLNIPPFGEVNYSVNFVFNSNHATGPHNIYLNLTVKIPLINSLISLENAGRFFPVTCTENKINGNQNFSRRIKLDISCVAYKGIDSNTEDGARSKAGR